MPTAVIRFLLLLFSFLIPFFPHAATLVFTETILQTEGTTLLILKFDVPLNLEFLVDSGDLLTINAPALDAIAMNVDLKGCLKQFYLQDKKLFLQTSYPVKGQLVPGGTGAFLIFLKKTDKVASEIPPIPPVQKPSEAVLVKESTVLKAPQVEKPKPKETEFQANTIISEPTLESTLPLEDERSRLLASETDYQFLPDDVRYARIIADRGRIEESIQILNNLTPQSEQYAWAQIVLGDIYVQLQQYNRAFSAFRIASENAQTAEIALIRSALLNSRIGDKEDAEMDWEQALVLITGEEQAVLEEDTQLKEDESIFKSKGKKESQITKPKLGGRQEQLKILYYLPAIVVLLAVTAYILKRRSDSRLYELAADLAPIHDIVDSRKSIAEENGLQKKVSGLYQKQASPEVEEQAAKVESTPTDKTTKESRSPVPAPTPVAPSVSSKESAQRPSDADWSSEDQPRVPKRKKIEEMYKRGVSVRDIASALNIGQDEVNMVLRLVSAENEE